MEEENFLLQNNGFLKFKIENFQKILSFYGIGNFKEILGNIPYFGNPNDMYTKSKADKVIEPVINSSNCWATLSNSECTK